MSARKDSMSCQISDFELGRLQRIMGVAVSPTRRPYYDQHFENSLKVVRGCPCKGCPHERGCPAECVTFQCWVNAADHSFRYRRGPKA